MTRILHLIQFLLVVLAAGAGAAPLPAPRSPLPAPWDTPLAGSASWKLLPEVQIDASGLFLHQLFPAAETTSATTPLRLTDAPSASQNLTLTRDQVVTLIRRQQPAFSETLVGADRVKVTRRTRLLGEAELLQQLTETLQRDHVRERGSLELRLTRAWTPVTIPDEPFLLKVLDLPTLGVTPNFIVRFELTGSRERFGDWQAIVQARVWRDILVARSTLKRGQTLPALDLTTERRDVLLLRDPLDAAARVDDSLELTENLTPGSPLTARSVRTRPLVTRGRLVDAVIQDGALNITLKVEVLEDGLAGQTVRVRNPVTRRELSGKVKHDQSIAISL